MTSRKLAFATTILILAGSTLMGRAQDASADSTQTEAQSDSVADAARKARAQKKDASKAVKVFTDDNVGEIKGEISVVGSEPAVEGDKDAKKADVKPASTTGASGASDSKPAEAKNEAYWRDKFATARKALADDTRELDILQREFSLKQEQFYQDPTAAMKQQYSREDLDKTQSQIDTKKQEIEKDNQTLADLADEMHRAGGDPGWANEPSGAGPSGSSTTESDASGSGGAKPTASGTSTSTTTTTTTTTTESDTYTPDTSDTSKPQ